MLLLQEHKHAPSMCFVYFLIGSFVASIDLYSDCFAAFYGYQVTLYIMDGIYVPAVGAHIILNYFPF